MYINLFDIVYLYVTYSRSSYIINKLGIRQLYFSLYEKFTLLSIYYYKYYIRTFGGSPKNALKHNVIIICFFA